MPKKHWVWPVWHAERDQESVDSGSAISKVQQAAPISAKRSRLVMQQTPLFIDLGGSSSKICAEIIRTAKIDEESLHWEECKRPKVKSVKRLCK